MKIKTQQQYRMKTFVEIHTCDDGHLCNAYMGYAELNIFCGFLARYYHIKALVEITFLFDYHCLPKMGDVWCYMLYGNTGSGGGGGVGAVAVLEATDEKNMPMEAKAVAVEEIVFSSINVTALVGNVQLLAVL